MLCYSFSFMSMCIKLFNILFMFLVLHFIILVPCMNFYFVINCLILPWRLLLVQLKLIAYLLQNVPTNYSFCWLIFLEISTFSRLLLLCERVDNGHTIVKIHIIFFCKFKLSLPVDWTCYTACEVHEVEMTSSVSHAVVYLGTLAFKWTNSCLSAPAFPRKKGGWGCYFLCLYV